MYADWRIQRWETPVSETDCLMMASLVDDGQLRIMLEAARDPKRLRWQFTFDHYPAYRNILEEYRMALWFHLDKTGQRCGWTFTVTDSPWIGSFRPDDPLLDEYYPGLQHFVISTEDDVIEILSPEPAKIEFLGPAPADAPPAGKSQILYHPEDREQIDRLLNDRRAN